MNDIVELSSGNVFARGSVRSIGTIEYCGKDYDRAFKVYGVGFEVTIHLNKQKFYRDVRFFRAGDGIGRQLSAQDLAFEKLRAEAIEALLGSPSPTSST